MLGYLNYRVACHPSIYIPVYRVFGKNKHCLINESTRIVIEGFPRSANTFAVVAFTHAQNKSVHIAHHLHVPAHVLEGIRRKLPVLVLIRHPLDAVRSLKIRHPGLNENEELRKYIIFYKIIASNIDRVVIGTFEDVISDFGSIIQEINKKFDSDFVLFNNSADERKIIFEKIEEIQARSSLDKINSIAIPMKEREQIKNSIKLDYREKLLDEAVCVYEHILNQSAGYQH